MNYSLTDVLGCTNASTFAERYVPLLENKTEGNMLLAELILCMDDLKHAKPSLFERFETSILVDFLILSHRHYTENVLPTIEKQLAVLIKQEDCPTLISEYGLFFFREFRNGLLAHFKYEEAHLFPFVEKKLPEDGVIFNERSFRQEHPHQSVNMEGLLMLLTSKGKAGEKSMSHRILMEKLNSLDKELSLHEFIEEEVLMKRLEAKGR